MELYQWVITGLIGFALFMMIWENDRVNQLVWKDMLATGRHIESVLHPTYWRHTDPKNWEFICLNDGSRGVISRVNQPIPFATHTAEYYVQQWMAEDWWTMLLYWHKN